jgi:hypothetical protein
MKLCHDGTCRRCGGVMVSGAFYQISRLGAPDASGNLWGVTHADGDPSCVPGLRQAPTNVTSGQAYLHINGHGSAGSMELVWPWPAMNTVDLRGFLRARLADIKAVLADVA